MKTFLLTSDKWRMNKILPIRLDFMFFNYLITHGSDSEPWNHS